MFAEHEFVKFHELHQAALRPLLDMASTSINVFREGLHFSQKAWEVPHK